MLKLQQVAPNMTVVEIGYITILFSYQTPVAGCNPDYAGGALFRTSKYYSATTAKHINKWFREEWQINPGLINEIDQNIIDNMVGDVEYNEGSRS